MSKRKSRIASQNQIEDPIDILERQKSYENAPNYVFTPPKLKTESSKCSSGHLHHKDWNHSNNDPFNLIKVPPIVHKVIHQSGVNDEEEFIILNKVFQLSKVKTLEEIMILLKTDKKLESISVDELFRLKHLPHPKFEKQNDCTQLLLIFPA